MKAAFLIILLFAQTIFAEDKKNAPAQASPPPAASPSTAKSSVTVKDAKKTCKEAGKEGAELLKCIKDYLK